MIEGKYRTFTTLLQAVTKRCLRKLELKRSHGWYGWRFATYRRRMEVDLVEHVARAMQGDHKHWIDVINYAAFLWSIGEAEER